MPWRHAFKACSTNCPRGRREREGEGRPGGGHRSEALGATLAALVWQLEENQWWDAATHETRQIEQLERILRHAGRTVPYYRDLWRARGFDPERPLTWERFRALPVLERTTRAAAGRIVAQRRRSSGARQMHHHPHVGVERHAGAGSRHRDDASELACPHGTRTPLAWS